MIDDAGALLALILEALPVAILAMDGAGRAYFANDLACTLLGDGIRPGAVESGGGTIYRPYIAGTDELYPRDQIPIVRALAGFETLVSDLELHHPDRKIPVSAWARPVYDDKGTIVAAVSTFYDITARQDVERALAEAEDRFKSAFTNAPIGMALVDTDGRWIQVNDALCELVGYARDDLLNRRFADITHPDDLDADNDLMAQVLAGDLHDYSMIKRYIRSDGQVVWVRLSVSLVRDAGGHPSHFIAQIQDITSEKAAQDQLADAAHTDPLTGLGNRREALDQIGSGLAAVGRTGGRLAVVFIDLNGFKQINDKFGHDGGDRVLTEVATRLRSHIRPNDAAARLGGDEFVCVLKYLSSDEATATAQSTAVISRLTSAIAQPIDLTGKPVTVSASFGLALTDNPTESTGDLLRRADAAMYSAKSRRG